MKITNFTLLALRCSTVFFISSAFSSPSSFAFGLDRSCSQPPYPTAPLIAFNIRMPPGPSIFKVAPYFCNFGTDAISYMHFEAHLSPTYFYDQKDLVGFGCTEKVNGEDKFVAPNIIIFQTVFANTSIKVSNCKYAPASEASTSQSTSTKSIPAHGASATNNPLNLQDNDKRLITQALHQSNEDISEAARKLGISKRALLRKMKDYRIGENGH